MDTHIINITGETHMLELPQKTCLAASVGISLQTKVGDMIQETVGGKTAKVLYFDTLHDTLSGMGSRLLIVSPTEKPEPAEGDEEFDTIGEVTLHGLLLPDEAFIEVEDVTKVQIQSASLALRYESDIPLAINMVIARLSMQYYDSEVTRMSIEMDAKH
jgi:hypothetical protein